jgi:hypothetical protein
VKVPLSPNLWDLNVWNGAKRLNGWNVWNGPIPQMNGAQRLNGLNDMNDKFEPLPLHLLQQKPDKLIANI